MRERKNNKELRQRGREGAQERQQKLEWMQEERGARTAEAAATHAEAAANRNAMTGIHNQTPIGYTPEGLAVYPGERIGTTKMVPKTGADKTETQTRDIENEIDRRAAALGIGTALDASERSEILKQAETDVYGRRGMTPPGRQAAPTAPPSPHRLPPGSMYSPSRKQWK